MARTDPRTGPENSALHRTIGPPGQQSRSGSPHERRRAGGGASLLGPEAAATATALTPAMEAVFAQLAQTIGQRRFQHAAQTVADAAEASGETVEGLLEQAVWRASSAASTGTGRVRQVCEHCYLFDQRNAGLPLLIPGVLEGVLCAIVVPRPHLGNDGSAPVAP